MHGPFFLIAAAGLTLAACEAATPPAPGQAATTVESPAAFPERTGRVVDSASLLSIGQEARLTDLLERLERQTSDQLVIVTVPSLQDQPIEVYSRNLANRWGVGQADKDNGVVLLVAPNQRQARIEVGIGLEPILTNSRAGEIIESDLLPMFREARWFEGIEAGAEEISETLIAKASQPRRGS